MTVLPPVTNPAIHHYNHLNMRLPYIADDAQMKSEEDAAIVQDTKDRRGGKLIALDKTLLHAPAIANGWNSFFGAIRTQTSLPCSIRELAICRVAVLNKARYEWEQHWPLLEATGVLSEQAVASLKERPQSSEGDKAGHTDDAVRESLFDGKHLAVLEYTDAMTLRCAVPDPIFAKLRSLFNDQEVMEITSTIAGYNCVSRILVALDVGEMVEKDDVDGIKSLF